MTIGCSRSHLRLQPKGASASSAYAAAVLELPLGVGLLSFFSFFGASLLGALSALFAVSAVLVLSPLFGLSLDAASAPARLRFFSLSDLKSVSYHPPPLRRNEGADMSRFSDGFSHSGQSDKGA